jgi:RNA polymerase sigma factor for flagellar operon FliA
MLNEPTDPYASQLKRPLSTREDLIAIGLPIVRRIAFRMARRLPPNVDVSDLIGAGTEGLLRAVQAYDQTRFPAFEPYAKTRIRGAMLDELRANDSLTRYGRGRMGEITHVIRTLQQQLGRQPDEEEVAARLGVSLEQYQNLVGDLARGPALLGFSSVSVDDAESSFLGPDVVLTDAQLKRRLAEAITQLSPRMQQVLALYYQEECTQAEIGQILSVTESRVCQILGEATLRLRAMLLDAPEVVAREARTGT